MPGDEQDYSGPSLLRKISVFIAHELNAMFGISLATALIVNHAKSLLFLFGGLAPYWTSNILSFSPIYPVQISMALLLGWCLGLLLQHRAMLWVWIIPLGMLAAIIATHPTGLFSVRSLESIPGSNRWSHYFGWGCQLSSNSVITGSTAYPCRDQAGITLPFYAASFYALGYVLARITLAQRSLAGNKKIYCVFLITGSVFVATAAEPIVGLLVKAARYLDIDPFAAFRVVPWWWSVLTLGTDIIFPGALGAYFLISARRLRDEASSKVEPAEAAQI